MKTFEVHKEELRGSLMSGEIYGNGDYINEADELEIITLTTGYSVYLYGEQGVRIGTEFYPVYTNTENWESNEEKVLEDIKRDYPPTEYQNNNW